MFNTNNRRFNNFNELECSTASYTSETILVNNAEVSLLVLHIAGIKWCFTKDISKLFYVNSQNGFKGTSLFKSNKRVISSQQLSYLATKLNIPININPRGLAIVPYNVVQYLSLHRQFKNENGSKQLYFIFNRNKNTVKIGIADDSDRRLNQIVKQGGFGNELTLLHVEHITPSVLAEKLEKKIHNYFSEFRYVGEWFKLSKERIKKFINEELTDLKQTFIVAANPV